MENTREVEQHMRHYPILWLCFLDRLNQNKRMATIERLRRLGATFSHDCTEYGVPTGWLWSGIDK